MPTKRKTARKATKKAAPSSRRESDGRVAGAKKAPPKKRNEAGAPSKRKPATKPVKKRMRGPDKKPRKKRTDHPKPPPGKGGQNKGQRLVLPKGAIEAIRAMRWRVPPDTPEPAAELADEALEAVVDVMRSAWRVKGSQHRLKAAVIVRNEIVGPIAQRVDVTVNETAKKIEAAARRAGLPRADDDDGDG